MIISTLILVTALMFLLQTRINSMINTFILQSILLATAAFLHATQLNEIENYISVILIIILKVIFIPYLLKKFVRKFNVHKKVAEIKYPFLLLSSATLLILFCYQYVIPENHILATAMSIVLLSMALLITHHKAISHVIGFMSMENGIFLAALTAYKGMPMVVELGVAFDVLIAAILFGVFFLQLRRSIDSLNVDKLNLLREDQE